MRAKRVKALERKTMVDNNTNTVINTNTVHMTEKQKVKEITDRLEEGLKELLRVKSIKVTSPLCQNSTITALTIRF